MHVDGITAGEAVTQALAAQDARRAAETQIRILDKALESEQTMAAELLRALGVGQNLDVVG